MTLVARRVAWLLPLLLSACVHNANQSQMQPLAPPIEDTPPLPPDSAPANLPAPEYHIPKTDKPVIVVQGEPPKPATKHRKPKPAAGAPGATTPGQPNTQVASETPPAEVSAIGQFATTEPPDTKRQAADSITEVEKGLSGITRHLSDGDEKTSTQIKEFLKQAKAALATGDAEGANTLAQKAKVLLKELSQ
jgi:hypothetical protein